MTQVRRLHQKNSFYNKGQKAQRPKSLEAERLRGRKGLGRFQKAQ